MEELGGGAKFNARHYDKANTHAGKIYLRLLRYALAYKAQLIVSLLFAMAVAVSFGSMLMATGGVIQVLFGDEAETWQQVDEMALNLQGFADRMESTVGWGPDQLDQQFRDLVTDMRAHRMVALVVLSAILVVLTFLAGVARYLQEFFAGAISASISVKLMEEMYRNVMEQPLHFFEERSTGELLARFTNDVFMINRGLTGVFVKLLREPFKAVLFLAVAIQVDPVLTLIGMCVLPLVGYIVVAIGKSVRRNVRRSLERVANFASVAKESFTGIGIVKAYGMESYQVSRVQGELTNLRKYLLRMIKADAAVGPLAEFVMVLGVVVFLLLAGKRFEAGLINAGGLARLFGALALMLDPLRKLTSVNNAIQQSVASAERVFEFIDVRPNIVEAPDAIELPRLADAVRFDNVHFAYPGKEEVLRGITCEIRKGQMVALVGFSGAGKTTIAKLLPRFYDPTGGAITIDGVDLRKATFASLRGQIGIVTQETILFDETIRDNIACGHAEYGDGRVREAARIAHATEFIEATPNGFDTRIGESGGTLSGGQRQRLAIARALAKDPAILILDEATSSLDSESERAIQQAIEESIVGRTTIVIAHRLSTILRADQILVIDNGQIAERGTHRELIAMDGLYNRLYAVQFADSPNGAK
ncbi:MAG: ATP-binding cassette, subfamily bacterial MsbA [Candidatus Hydrogenedentes bacterium]|nr:ATP-binding cassette, subfamily bacterial MsbA [Candidatus Hydrogenedentota bacterium]